MSRHDELRATWAPGQIWETRSDECADDPNAWVPVGDGGRAQPAWDERQEYRLWACRAEEHKAGEWVCDCAAPRPDCKPVVDQSPQLRQLCEALGWQGGTFWQVLAEIGRLRAAASGAMTGTRQPPLPRDLDQTVPRTAGTAADGAEEVVRQRRELIDLGRAVADKLHAAMQATNDKAVRYLIGEADALAVKFYQHLPNSPEDTPAGVGLPDGGQRG
jgi:hypothetical protein